LKYKPDERATISALKYQADLYHVNLRQKNQNVAHSSSSKQIQQPLTQRQAPKVKINLHPQPQIHSLKRVDS
jgi:hypothetical protein